MPHLSFITPVGDLTLFQQEAALVAIEWGRASEGSSTPLLQRARVQLEAYFDGTLTSFDLPLRPDGTSFQQNVWLNLQHIPYGAVRTYGDLAAALGTSPRAIGTACGRNPIPIVIPCHRVVGSDHTLIGFSGGEGLSTKHTLLSLENTPGFSNLTFEHHH